MQEEDKSILDELMGMHQRNSGTETEGLLHQQAEEALRRRREQLEQRTNQLLALQKVTTSIQSTLDLKEVSQQVTEAVVINLGYDHSLILVLDEKENVYRGTAFFARRGQELVGEVEQVMAQALLGIEIPAVRGFSRAFDDATDGRATMAHNLYEIVEPPLTRRECNAVQELLGSKTIICMPLLNRKRLMGAILAFTRREDITEVEAEPLSILASHAEVAIENACYYQQTTEMAQQLAVTAEVSRIIGSSLDIREVYDAFTREIKRIIDFDRASIALVEGDRLRFFAVYTDADVGLSQGDTAPLEESATAWVMEHKQTNIETDFSQMSHFPIDKQLLRSGLRSAIRVPLCSNDRVFGTFNLSSRRANAYGEKEREILEQLAGQIAVAIENHRLFMRVKQHEADLERAYEELKAAQDYMVQSARLRALGEMAGGVAHDFNNVLAIILGRAQLALEESDDNRLKKSLQIIEQTALDAAGTVRRLQDFARVRVDRTFEAVNLKEMVEGALQMVESRRVELSETAGVNIDISTELAEVPPVAGDAAELREALVNIIFNAIDAMPDGGKIMISSRHENSWVVLSVRDTGIGIEEDIREKVFDPFFTTRAPSGSGLGLSVTYGIITRHGGNIDVESTPGKGSIFHIKLPVSNEVGEKADAEHKTRQAKGAKILLIDDDPEVIEVLGLMLQQLGHWVRGITNGRDALNAFKEDNYDLVVTDLGMPDTSGRDIARSVKELKPETSVLLITGWGVQLNPEDMPEVDGVIAKPFSKDVLSEQITSMLPAKLQRRRKTDRPGRVRNGG